MVGEGENQREREDGWEGSCATSAGMSVSVLVCKYKKPRRKNINVYGCARKDLSITWACWQNSVRRGVFEINLNSVYCLCIVICISALELCVYIKFVLTSNASGFMFN